METRTYTVYKFAELTDKAQEKAVEKLYNINVDDSFWYEAITDNRKLELSKKGFEESKISFSGFSSQGDGASFKCSVDLEKWFETRPMDKQSFAAIFAECKDTDNYSMVITKDGRYEHEMTMRIDSQYYGENKNANKELALLEEIILEDARKEARAIYTILESEYDYLTGKEAVIDSIQANDYDFESDGSLA